MGLDDEIKDENGPDDEDLVVPLDDPDAEARNKEAELIEETDNGPRPEDGPQPAQDEEPELVSEDETNQPDVSPEE